jgi:hypothetical protein
LGGNSNYYQVGPTTVTIAGTQVYYCQRLAWDTKKFPAAKGSVSGSLVVSHDELGGLKIALSLSTSIYTGVLKTCSGEWTLDSIPRKATLTSVPNFTDVDNPSISFSNPGGFPIDVWLEPNPIGDHLCERKGIPNTGSYTWILTAAERDALRNKCAGISCPIRVGIYTTIGSTQHADYRDVTYTMTANPATKPTVSMDISVNNGTLPSIFDGILIQGKSRIDAKIFAEAKYGAKIVSYHTDFNLGVYNGQQFTSDPIRTSGSNMLMCVATDSRGIYEGYVTVLNVLEYSKPWVVPAESENAILCYRSDGNGKRAGNSTSVWIKARRSYHKISQKNSCALQWRRKLATEEWNDANHLWSELLPKTVTTTDEYNGLLPGVEFDLRQAYTIQVKATDDIGEYDIKTLDVPTRDVSLHLGRGGKNVAIGTYCDYSKEYTFYSEWEAIFGNGVVIGDMPVADHIVETGTSGIWTYEKRASGIARCWAKIPYSVDLVGENSRAYVNLNSIFPIMFTDVPFCNLTLSNQTTWNHVLSSIDFTQTMLTRFSVYRLGAGANVTAGGTADIMAIGYWK